jgi:hypothetical protein
MAFVMSAGRLRKWRCIWHTAICKPDLDDKVPHHSSFWVDRLGRFREREILRHIFERLGATCMAAGLSKAWGSPWMRA